MKYLCLAYGDEKDWRELSKAEQDKLLEQDEVLRQRGDLVAVVDQSATTVRAWDGVPETSEGGFAESRVPLAGFAIIVTYQHDRIQSVPERDKDASRSRSGTTVLWRR